MAREFHHGHPHFGGPPEPQYMPMHEQYGGGHPHFAHPHFAPANLAYQPQYPHPMHMQHADLEGDVVQSVQRHDLGRAFRDLHEIQFHESRQLFHQHLSRINHELHERGILPNLSIVEARSPEGFALQPDRQPYMPHPHYPPHQADIESGGYRGYRHHHGRNHYTESGSPQSYNANDDSGYHYDPTGKTYDGARRVDAATLQQSAKIVAQVAREMGVDPTTAVAMMLVESGGNPQAVGDRGTSFGLFQLHRGGELGRMSPQEAFDPVTNARTALAVLRTTQGHYGDPGSDAAAAQRPRNRAAYARLVDSALPEARRLLAMA